MGFSLGQEGRAAVICTVAILCSSFLNAAQAQPTHTDHSGGHMHHKSSHHGSGPAHAAGTPSGLVYVYDMPPEFTDDIRELPAQWHPEQYDYDQVLHKHLLESGVRAHEPEQAQLFFIPAYLGRHYNWYWQQWSTPGDAWDVNADCPPEYSKAECFWVAWNGAKTATSEAVRRALAHVRDRYPYWDRKNGADHFMVFSYDHGRCDMAPALGHAEWGQMFAIQSYGDITTTNVPEVPPTAYPWREQNYSWGGPRAWACFRPDADVLVPMYYESAAADIVAPRDRERPITLLMRFGYQLYDGKNLVEHYGHRLRYELIEYWKAQPLPGSQHGPKSVQETEADMEAAVFCLCPPGQTQDTVRVWRSIVKGCIPVTLFRANDLPFARFLGVPYEDFVVNIQPDDYAQLNTILQSILDDEPRLRRMQDALQAHQHVFVWDAAEPRGIIGSIELELAHRAATLDSVPRSVLT